VTYDLIALGETMMTFCPPSGGILADAVSLILDHGGAESNTCVGLARLGLKVAWISKLGCDPFGDRILEALNKEGVDTRWVVRDDQRPTGLMMKDPRNRRVLYYRSGSAASTLSPEDLEGIPIAEARAVLVTGITAQIGAGPQRAAIALLEAARGLRAVDPNLRRGLVGSDRRCELVLPLIQGCDLVLAGDHELAEIFGAFPPEQLGRLCAAQGPGEVVVRCDSKAGVYRNRDGWIERDVPHEDAADPMGAGDAFNAGYIAARLGGEDIDATLALATRCGRAVALTPGDTAGFPRGLRPKL
jgi:2-dehydro-3-deoxygluconokinase